MIRNNTCPVCSGSEIVSKYKCKDHLISGEHFSLLECRDCRFIFISTPPEEEEIARYYKSEDYISHSNTRKGIVNILYHRARQLMLSRKYRIVKKYTGISKGSILDIGSGTGYFPGYLKSRGWQASAIEADDEAAKYTLDNFGIKAEKLENLGALQSSEFDAITLWHVLEHLYDPKSILNEVFRLLKDNGICVVALPNSDSFDARWYKESWAAWDVPRHLWHFNLQSFRKLLDGNGLDIVAVRKMPLDAFYVSMLSEKNNGSVISLLKGVILGSLTWLLTLFKKTKSSSLIYVLRKID